MTRKKKNLRTVSLLFLSLLLLFSSLPVTGGTLYAEDSPLTLIGFGGKGMTVSDPVLYGDPYITLSGYFTSGLAGENLRIKILTNNGRTVDDLANLNPTVSGNQFTFRDLSLKPGLNEIVFYERVGSITRELLHFYVQYNNTPLVTELRVNDLPLHDPAVDQTPTLITVPSTSRLTLTLDGKVKNAESVEVTNTRTGEVIRGEVVNGILSVKVPALLGENRLDLRVYNLNKEVILLNRTILVTTTSTEDDHLFYQTAIGGQALSAERPVTITGSGDASSGPFALTGKALLHYTDTQNRTFSHFTLTLTQTDNPAVSESITLQKKISPSDPTGFTLVGTPQSGFTQYDLSASIPQSIAFQHGKTYTAKLSYTYTAVETGQTVETQQTVEVTNYPYSFTYVNQDRPRFGSLVNTITGTPLSLQGENPVATSPLMLKVYTFQMGDASGTPNPDFFTFTYNGAPLSAGDYTLTDFRSEDAAQKMGSFLLTLNRLPAGSGRLSITYDDPADGVSPLSLSALLRVEITPYVLLTYLDGTETKSFEDGTEIRSADEIKTLNGKVFNYLLKEDKANLRVEINGQNLTSDAQITVDSGKNTFAIADTLLRNKLVTGNNLLKISLTDAPETSFSYTIIYFTAQLPEITDVKIETELNGKVNELVKAAGDPAYRTTALFLRSFQFKVKNATRLYVEKNGKRIIDYVNNGPAGTPWVLNESSEYKSAVQEVSLTPYLGSFFVNRNFLTPTSGSPFLARMTSSQYGDLVAEVENDVTTAYQVEALLSLFPLTLAKQGSTTYTIVAENDQGTITRYSIQIERSAAGWEVISPAKAKETDPYIVVNANSVPIRLFAENASRVMFGKAEASVQNTTNPDFYYDDALGRMLPKTYYVFETTVVLKPGLNRIPFTVEAGGQSYKDELVIYNANASISGAEYRDVLGKKTAFAPFDKKIQLTFPQGTKLLSPSKDRVGDEIRDPQRSSTFVETPLYFGIADRTTGQVKIGGENMKSRLILNPNFTYASNLYYIDAGDTDAPIGRDPYYSGDGMVNGSRVNEDEFHNRYQDNLVPSNRGTLTLQYDPNIVNAAGNILTVFFNDGSGWENIGGVVDTGRKTITVPFERFGYYMVMKTRQTFSDIVYHPFARNDMETLYAKGIMPNYSGSSFGAERYITRGEMATILVKALDLPINAGPYNDSYGRDPLEPHFYDVRPAYNEWDYDYKYIETAARAGIVNGKEPGYFRPAQNLSRQEGAVMIARALNLKTPKSPEDAMKQLGKAFTDAKDMDYYAQQSIAAVTKAGLMVGSPNDPKAKKPTYAFHPDAPLTRAEMAVITVRVMIQMKKLPKL